ncbi:MAG: HAD family hydrolase [Candidatus Saccharimonadales bacterium]
MTLVFDFDGTLADSLSVMLDIYNLEIAPKWGLKKVTSDDWHMLRQSSIPKGLKYIGVKPYQLANLIKEARRLVKARARDIQLFPGAAIMIKQLAAEGHEIYALSTNDQAVIRDVFKLAGIEEEITILKSPRLFGKANSLKRLLRQPQVSAETTWMIGDEVRDMVAAKRVAINSIAVTWGFQPEITLAALQPTAIAHTLTDITNILHK